MDLKFIKIHRLKEPGRTSLEPSRHSAGLIKTDSANIENRAFKEPVDNLFYPG